MSVFTFLGVVKEASAKIPNPADPEFSEISKQLNLAQSTDLYSFVLNIVGYLLSFLGLLAVLLILYGGFLWMTSRGNDDQVSTAKDTITAGIIGLIIILSAWAISAFVINLFS